jgi:hypothetical protein
MVLKIHSTVHLCLRPAALQLRPRYFADSFEPATTVPGGPAASAGLLESPTSVTSKHLYLRPARPPVLQLRPR